MKTYEITRYTNHVLSPKKMASQSENEFKEWLSKKGYNVSWVIAKIDRDKSICLERESNTLYSYDVTLTERRDGFTYNPNMCVLFRDSRGYLHEVGVMKANTLMLFHSFMDNTVYASRSEFETRVKTYFD